MTSKELAASPVMVTGKQRVPRCSKLTDEELDDCLNGVEYHMTAAAKHLDFADLAARQAGLVTRLLYANRSSMWFQRGIKVEMRKRMRKIQQFRDMVNSRREHTPHV